MDETEGIYGDGLSEASGNFSTNQSYDAFIYEAGHINQVGLRSAGNISDLEQPAEQQQQEVSTSKQAHQSLFDSANHFDMNMTKKHHNNTKTKTDL